MLKRYVFSLSNTIVLKRNLSDVTVAPLFTPTYDRKPFFFPSPNITKNGQTDHCRTIDNVKDSSSGKAVVTSDIKKKKS